MNRLPRWAGPALDALALGLLAALMLGTWHHGALGPGTEPPPDAPAWATLRDYLLDGPDAGRWAYQAIALRDGLVDRLDPHRMPTWTLLTEAALPLTGGRVPLAGHLVNHLLRVLVPVAGYALGRGVGAGRVAAFGAGLAAGFVPVVTADARIYGVDMSVTFAWVGGMAVATQAGRLRHGGLGAGAVAALTSATHFTTLPSVLPELLACAAVATPGQRGRRVGEFVVAFVVVSVAIYAVLPAMSPTALYASVVEGIAPHTEGLPGAPGEARAGTILREGLQLGPARALGWAGKQTMPAHLPPWGLLPLLGAVLVGFGGRDRVARHGAPLATLCVLAPAPVLFMASAPSRYVDTLGPVLVTLAVCGVAVFGATVDRLVRLGLRRWPAVVEGVAAVGFAGVLSAGRGVDFVPLPPVQSDLVALQAADALRARFPGGVGVASVVHEPVAMAEDVDCPTTVHCPATTGEDAYWHCLRVMASTCPGTGDLPYLVVERLPRDDRSAERAAMDAWVEGRWTPFVALRSPTLRIAGYALPRDTTPQEP